MQGKPNLNLLKSVSKIKFATKYNPMLPKIDCITKRHISTLHSDDALHSDDTLHSHDALKISFLLFIKQIKIKKKLIARSSYPKKIKPGTGIIMSWSNCDICKIYITFDNTFVFSLYNYW